MHAKAFVGSRGGAILYKTFPYFYIFHRKNDCLDPNLDSLAFKNEKNMSTIIKYLIQIR